MTETEYKRLIVILRQFSAPNRRIENSTRLNDDLHIYGEDAHELFDKIGKEFKIISIELNIADYFYSEEEIFLPYIISAMFLKRKKPLTVSDLTVLIDASRPRADQFA